jgi:hypothetical protein
MANKYFMVLHYIDVSAPFDPSAGSGRRQLGVFYLKLESHPEPACPACPEPVEGSKAEGSKDDDLSTSVPFGKVYPQ